VLIAGPLIVLRTRWAWNEACSLARQQLPKVLHLDLAIARCEIDPLTQGMKLYDVAASVPGQAGPPLLTAESAEVRLGLFPPLFGTPQLAMVHLAHPHLRVDLAELKPPPKGQRVCPLDALEQVSLERLLVHDATVELKLPGGRGLELNAVDLEWTTRRGVVELDLKAGSGVARQGAGRPELLIGQTRAQASLDLEAQQLQIGSAEGQVDDVTWNVGGKVDTLCDPNLSLDVQAFVPLRTLDKVVALPDKPQGHVLARVMVNGRPEALALTADLTGAGIQIGKLAAPSATARISLEGKELRVHELAVPAGPGGVARLTGTVQLQPGYPIRMAALMERAELGPVLDVVGMKGAWVNVVTSGRVLLAGTGNPLQLEGEGDLGIQDFKLTSRAWDAPAEGSPILEFKEGQAKGTFQVLPDRVELTQIDATAGRSKVSVKGQLRYAEEAGMQLDGKAELDLSELGHLARFDWRGSSQVSFSLHGPYRDVRAEAQLSARDMAFWDYNLGTLQGELAYDHRALHLSNVTGQKGKTPYSGSVDLDWGKEKNGAMRLSLNVPRGRVEDLVEMILRLHSSVELFQGELFGDAAGSVELRGPFDRFGGTIDLDLSRLTYYGRDIGRGRARLEFKNGEVMELAEARLWGASGRLEAEGSFTFGGGPLRYRFHGDDLDLEELVGPKLARQMGVTGKVQVSGRVTGDREVPVVETYLSSPRVTFADQSLGIMNLNARIQGRELEVIGRPFDAASGVLKMTLKAPIPYQLRLSLALPEIRPLLPDTAISQGLSGSVSGSINARGEVKTKDSAVVQAKVEQLSLSRGDFAAQSAAPVNVRLERGRLFVDGLVLTGPDTQLSAGGWLGPETLDVKAQGAADMRLLASFLPGLERAGGQVEVSANATGPLSSPAVLGTARIRDVRFSLRDQPFQLRSLSGDVEFSERQARVSNLDGVLNDGRVALQGYVEMDQFQIRRGCSPSPCMHVQLQMDEIAMRPAEDLPFTTSGALEAYGDPDSMVLAGGLTVDHLRYARPMDLEAFLKDFARTRERLVQSSQTDRRKDWLKFNVSADLGDVRVENNLARARFQGRITLTGSNARPGLIGTIEAAEGSKVFFRQNRFDVSELLIELKDRYSVDAIFDLHAQSQVREYLVRLHAFGKPSEPKVILTSEPMLAEADVLSLLTLGVTSKDKSQSTGVETATYLAAEALYNASGLDREVQRFLPKNTQLVKDLSFHFSTSYNDVLHQMEPAAQIETRLLTDDLKLELTRPFSGRGTRARAEYRLLDGVLVQGQWDNENSTSGDLGNLGVDLKLHWEVK
jgi:translocation and assembly module TamB